MKIWGNAPKIPGVYDKQKNINKADITSDISTKKDLISISSQENDFQTVLKKLKDIPDIRRDKIDELGKKYEAGEYNVNGVDVADKIVKAYFSV